jgi:hypothetical protein
MKPKNKYSSQKPRPVDNPLHLHHRRPTSTMSADPLFSVPFTLAQKKKSKKRPQPPCPYTGCSEGLDHLCTHYAFTECVREVSTTKKTCSVPQLVCRHCGWKAGVGSKRSDMRSHIMKEHGFEKPLQCPREGCDFSTPDPLELRTHCTLCLTKAKEVLCLVYGCLQVFHSVEDRKVHVDEIHRNKTGRFLCERGCQQSFANYETGNHHMLRPHQCIKCTTDGCTETFYFKGQLRRHLLVCGSRELTTDASMGPGASVVV